MPPTPTSRRELPAINLLFLISLLAAVLLIVNIWQRGWRLPIIAVGLWAFVAVVAGTIYPTFVQRFVVEPAESERERPYIERNIGPRAQRHEPRRRDRGAAHAGRPLDSCRAAGQRRQLQNVRLLDPTIVSPTRSSGSRASGATTSSTTSTSTATTVDSDDAEQVVLGARELNPSDLPQRHVGGPPPRLHPRLRAGHGSGHQGDGRRPPGLRREGPSTARATCRSTRRPCTSARTCPATSSSTPIATRSTTSRKTARRRPRGTAARAA